MLATLFKDERCQQLPAYAILEKMWVFIKVNLLQCRDKRIMNCCWIMNFPRIIAKKLWMLRSSMSLKFRYLDRIIKSSELLEFENLLQQHQKAITSDGRTCTILLTTSFFCPLQLKDEKEHSSRKKIWCQIWRLSIINYTPMSGMMYCLNWTNNITVKSGFHYFCLFPNFEFQKIIRIVQERSWKKCQSEDYLLVIVR